MSIQYATLSWQNNQPFSPQFDDVYFSRESGLDETRYVFLQHNALEQRWYNLADEHFTICETGFGTGLNFLCAWQLWLQSAPVGARLHFISCERYPLSNADLKRALALWPALAPLAQQLCVQYQSLSPGMQRLTFAAGRVQLTLLIGDACSLLGQLQATVDAWFLDGFAPARNPDLWQASLYAQMARLSGPDSSFATFTSAGMVRRGLENVGFIVEKVTGFGRKRTMLKGWRKISDGATELPDTKPRHAIVIGGGIAGCSSSHALATRGWQVTLLDRHSSVAAEASGNQAAMLYPRLAMQETVMSRLALAGFLYTCRLLNRLQLPANNFQQCGLLQLAFNAREAARHYAIVRRALSTEIVHEVDAQAASKIAGIDLQHGGLHFPHAGWVKPAEFCKRLIEHSNIKLMLGRQAQTLRRHQRLWQVWENEELLAEAPVLIIAAANESPNFNPASYISLQAVRGQITVAPASSLSRRLRCVICTDGYISPASSDEHCLGATFTPGDTTLDIRASDHQANMAMLSRLAPALQQSLNAEAVHGRAALRATTHDYMPVVGQLLAADTLVKKPPRHNSKIFELPYLEGLFINTGHGSKGISQAPLCAELLASAICCEPLPLDEKLTAALDPNRFVLRQLGLKRMIRGLAGAKKSFWESV